MEATALEWGRLRPGTSIEWSFRPLAAFNDEPVEELAPRFDVLVIDHPFVGRAAATGCLLALDTLLGADELAVLAADAVGASHASYRYAGRQWALAIDAACQVAVAREDLLDGPAPRSWDDVCTLAASRPGAVALPLYPTDAICSLLTLCATLGAPAGHGERFFPDPDAGKLALGLLSDLVPLLHPASLELSPPGVLDLMRATDEIAYVPLVFGYTNYARQSVEGARLRFLEPPSAGDALPSLPLLGGAGIAVSRSCEAWLEAVAFASWVAGAAAQREVVFPAGGQPASRSAWLDPVLDAACGGFFSVTLCALERAHVRPREPWWPAFQEEAGVDLQRGLAERAAPESIAAELEATFRRHRRASAITGAQ